MHVMMISDMSDALAAAGATSRGDPAPPALVLHDHSSLGVGAHGAWEEMATTTQDVGELVGSEGGLCFLGLCVCQCTDDDEHY